MLGLLCSWLGMRGGIDSVDGASGGRSGQTGLLAHTSVAGSVRVLHELAQVGLVCVTCFERTPLLRLSSVGLAWASVIIVDADLASPPPDVLIPSLRRQADCPVLLLHGRGKHTDAGQYGADAVLSEERPIGDQLRPWLRWPASGEVMEYIGLRLDRGAQLASWHGAPLRLTSQQFRLLWRLAEARGAVVPLPELSEVVYEGRVGNDRQRVMAHVRRIRRLIEPDPRHPRTLQAVRGIGFRLAAALPATGCAARSPRFGARRAGPAALAAGCRDSAATRPGTEVAAH